MKLCSKRTLSLKYECNFPSKIFSRNSVGLFLTSSSKTSAAVFLSPSVISSRFKKSDSSQQLAWLCYMPNL